MKKTKIISYGVSALLPFAVFLFCYLTGNPLRESVTFLVFTQAIITTSWFGGLKPGIASAILSTIFSLYLHQNTLSTAVLPSTVLLLNGVIISFLLDNLRHSEVLEKLQDQQEQITKKNKALQVELAQAQEEIKARDEFLSIASHELKSPLTAMILQIQTALHNIKSVSLANFSVAHLLKMLESVESQTNRLTRMITDLLNISLITTHKMELEKEDVDLTELTQNVVDSFTEKLAKEGYDLKLEYDKPVVGKWDKVRMEQVVTNLITNAIKYGDKKPINIKVANSNNSGKIIVSDHGVGIPEEQKEMIFNLFERADTSKGQKGLGVGLFITNQIVKAHGGEVNVKSRVGSGSTFTIELPLSN